MARAIVRYSFSGENSNTSGNAIAASLTEAGFEKHGRTACYEADGPPIAAIKDALGEVLRICETPREPAGRLDHLWIYVDDPRWGADSN